MADAFLLGSRVKLVNLDNVPNLNGTHGTVVGHDGDKAVVHLDAQETEARVPYEKLEHTGDMDPDAEKKISAYKDHYESQHSEEEDEEEHEGTSDSEISKSSSKDSDKDEEDVSEDDGDGNDEDEEKDREAKEIGGHHKSSR